MAWKSRKTGQYIKCDCCEKKLTTKEVDEESVPDYDFGRVWKSEYQYCTSCRRDKKLENILNAAS